LLPWHGASATPHPPLYPVDPGSSCMSPASTWSGRGCGVEGQFSRSSSSLEADLPSSPRSPPLLNKAVQSTIGLHFLIPPGRRTETCFQMKSLLATLQR
jgi:hypothetical protein